MGKLFSGHSGEYLSMGSAVLLTCAAAYFFWFVPNWNPTSDWPKYLLAWLVIGYTAVQLITLLETVLSVRFTGIVDTVLTIVPFVLGLVALVNLAQGTVHLSEYQEQALYLLLATSLLDFIATLWIRFAVNRRTLGIDASSSPL
jgi:DMSO reductase anchor subunit